MCIHSDTVLIELYQQETYVTPKKGINMLEKGAKIRFWAVLKKGDFSWYNFLR